MIKSLNPHHSLIAEVDTENVRSLELSESTPRSQRAVPTEWALAADGGTIELQVRCPRGTHILITELPSKALTRCKAGEATFQMPLASPARSGLSLFLNELSEFHARLSVERVQADIDAGHLQISDAGRDLPSGPVPIDLRASSDSTVDLDITQSVDTDQNHISLESDRADRVEVDNHDERRSRLDEHMTFVYFVLGLIAATLIPAGVELVLRRLAK